MRHSHSSSIGTKALAVLLALSLVATMVPATALAAVSTSLAQDGMLSVESEDEEEPEAEGGEDDEAELEAEADGADEAYEDEGSDGDAAQTGAVIEAQPEDEAADGAGEGGSSSEGSSLSALADDYIAEGTTGDGVSWCIDSDGVFYLYPTDGESGTLGSYKRSTATEDDHDAVEYSYGSDDPEYVDVSTPWIAYADEVTKVVVGNDPDGSVSKGTLSAAGSLSGLFYGFSKAEDFVALGRIDTSGATDFSYMFYGCSSFSSNASGGNSSDWDTSNVTSVESMFEYCTLLDDIGWLSSSSDFSSVTDFSYMFAGCTSFPELEVEWKVSNGEDFSYMFAGCTNLSCVTSGGWETSSAENMNRMFSDCENLDTLELPSDFVHSSVTSCYYMFYQCYELASLDVSGWDMSNVTNACNMFQRCYVLESLDVSKWDTGNLKSPYAMFADCYKLASLDVSGWDMSSATRMDRMFRNCYALTSLDFSTWDTSKATRMDEMFKGCTSLVDLDLSSFTTGNVTSMYQMFALCSSLEHLDLSGFDTLTVVETAEGYRDAGTQDTSSASTMGMYQMFYSCDALASVYLGASWEFDVEDSASYLPNPPTTYQTWVRLDEAFGPYKAATLAEKWTTSSSSEASAVSEDASESGEWTGSEDGMEGIWVWGQGPETGSLSVSITVSDAAPSADEFHVTVTYTEPGGTESQDEVLALSEDNGWTATLSLAAGTTYSVSAPEITEGYELVDVTGGSGSASDGSGTIVVDETDEVVVDYEVSATGVWSAVAEKTVENGDVADYDGAFTFQIEALFGTDADGNDIEASDVPMPSSTADTTAVNDETGAVVFDEIAYGEDDVDCTYYYKVSEVIPSSDDDAYDADFTYDTTVYTYIVTVVDDGTGTLDFDQTVVKGALASASYADAGAASDDAADPEFVNTLAEGTLVISKTVEDGVGESLLDTFFTFHVVLTNANSDVSGVDADDAVAGTLDSAYSGGEGSVDDSSGEEDNAKSSPEALLAEESLSAAASSLAAAAEAAVEGEASEGSSLSALATASDDDIASGTDDDGDVSWLIDSSGVLYIYPTDGNSGSLPEYSRQDADEDSYNATGTDADGDAAYYYISTPWYEYRDQIVKAVIEDGVSTEQGTTCLFYGCSNMEKLEGAANLDVTGRLDNNMSYTFYGCSSLEALDLSSWEVSGATEMIGMFQNCSNLASLAVLGWDVSKVTNMSYLLEGASELASLDLTGWSPESVTNFSHMFAECNGLSELTLDSTWSTDSAELMSYMFSGCETLETLDVSSWDVSGVTDMDYLFEDCRSLATLDVSSWDTGSALHMQRMFSDCQSLQSLDVSGFDVSGVSIAYYMFYKCQDEAFTSLDVSEWDTGAMENVCNMFQGCTYLATLNVSSWDTSSMQYVYAMFADCYAIEQLEVGGWDMSSATRMDRMFRNCTSLKKLDVDGWDVSKVTRMYQMFWNCSSLVSFDPDDSTGANELEWDTGKVTTMYQMFQDCSSLEQLDLSSFSTGNVTSMYQMFQSCTSLVHLDVSGFDTSEAIESAEAARETDASDDTGTSSTAATTGLANMFTGDGGALKSIALGASWDFDEEDTSSYLPVPDTKYKTWMRSDEVYGPYYVSTLAAKYSSSMAGIWVWGTPGEGYTVTFDVNLDTGDDETCYTGSMADQTWSIDGGETVPSCYFRYFGHTYAGYWTYVDDDGETQTLEPGTTVVTALGEVDDVVTLSAKWTASAVSSSTTSSFDITLTPGQTASFTLPAGTSYLVYEETLSGWELVNSSSTTVDDDAAESEDSESSDEEGTETDPTSTLSGTVTSNATTTLAYVNDVQDTPSASADVIGVKTLDGSAAVSGAFSFTLTPVSVTMDNGETLSADTYPTLVPMPGDASMLDEDDYTSAADRAVTVENAAAGAIVFDTISYSSAGTYVYTLTENAGNDDSIEYDDSTVYVIVTVTQDTSSEADAETDAGTLSATVAYSDVDPTSDEYDESDASESASFANVTKGQLEVSKEVTGTTLSSQTFQATVSYGDGASETVTLDSDNKWTWTSGYLNAGTTYSVSETSIPSGYTCESISNGSGTVVSGTTTEATLSNSYALLADGTGSVTWAPEATKTLTGGINLAGEKFDFEVDDESGKTVSTGSNAFGSYDSETDSASAEVSFSSVSFDSLDDVGTHTYTLSEVVPSESVDGSDGEDDDADAESDYDEDVVYDTSTYTAVVTVSDDGDGTLSVSSVYYDADGNALDGSPTFVNDYDHEVVLPSAGSVGVWFALLVALVVLLLCDAALFRRLRRLWKSGSDGGDEAGAVAGAAPGGASSAGASWDSLAESLSETAESAATLAEHIRGSKG